MKQKKEFSPIVVGTVNFANGKSFRITQVNNEGHALVNSDSADMSQYSTSISAAWRHVIYQGGVEFAGGKHKIGRTVGNFNNGPAL